MKMTQWIVLLAVLTAMVFGITFAVSSLPGRKSGGQKSVPQIRLTFADAETRFPATDPTRPGQAPRPAECELGQSQGHDFWFKNENAQDLPVGVFSKTCQCTSVELWVAPKDWTDVPEPAKRDEAAKKLESAATRTELKEKEGGVVVPAGAVGLLRLTWNGNRPGEKSLSATLWMGEKGPGPQQTFDIWTIFVNPVRAAAEYNVGVFRPDEFPKTVYAECWSSTRSEFPLDVELIHNRWKDKEASNPFELGAPVKMTAEELDKLRKDWGGGAVLSGYKAPLTLRRRSPDGTTPMDLGPFRQYLALKTPGADPIQTIVSGSIRGDLGPVNDNTVSVSLGDFDCTSKDVHELIQVASGSDVTRLELDKRTPDYLTVDADSLKQWDRLGGRKIWNLQVKWVPGSGASGKFPREEDEYRDSAVYVRPVYEKASESSPPCLRIPVRGDADTR